jgi:NDP-sugar pyrophosphorylase family protein
MSTIKDNKLAILIDPGTVPAFASLLDDYPFPLLPASTKPLIQHWIERLVEADFKNIVILVEHLPEKVRAFVEEGQRWGVNVSFASIRHGQTFKTQRALVDINSASHIFIAELMAFPKVELIEKLKSSKEGVSSVVGLSRWASKLAELEEKPLYEHDFEYVLPVTTPRELWQLNMGLLSSKVTDPLPFGFEAEPGVWVASNCKIGRNVRSFSPIVLGESTILSKNVIIGPNAVISERCVLDDGSMVKDSVVMGRTFIGSHIVINNMVVSGDMVYRVDDDVLLHINDIEILSRSDSNDQSFDLSGRLFALFTLVVMALPALLASLVLKLKGREAFIKETIYLEDGRDLSGVRQLSGLNVLSLNSEHRGWRKLPWLWWVLNQKLMLVGSSPRMSADFDYPSWVSDAEEFIPGVISQADLNNADDAESIVIADAYQLAQGEVGFSLSMWSKWLLSMLKI